MKLSEGKILNQFRKISVQTGLSVNELRVILALERAVARFESEPRLANHLIFKGGFLLFKSIDTNRYTRDIDALAHEISQSEVSRLIAPALYKDLSDCVWFRDVEKQPLINQGPYGGLRFNVAFHISDKTPTESQVKRLSRIHIDIGFGDAIEVPEEKKMMKSMISEIQPISWKVYPLESVFAEKLESVLRHGSVNSRAKDIYDLVLLFDQVKDKDALKMAIKRTFDNRGRKLPESFSETIHSFNTDVLERAWGAVCLMGGGQSFQEAKRELLKRLKVLDKTRY